MPVAIAALAARLAAGPVRAALRPVGVAGLGPRARRPRSRHRRAGRRGSRCRCSSTALLSPAGDAAPELWLVRRPGGLAGGRRARLPPRLAADVPRPRRHRPREPLRLAAGAAGAQPRRRARGARAGAALRPVHRVDAPVRRRAVRAAAGRARARRDRPRARAAAAARRSALGFAAALLRPEAWPLLAVYGVWLWRARARGCAAGSSRGAVAVPALWLVPDLLGSGDALTGAERAREATGAPLHEAVEALGRALEMPLAVALGAAPPSASSAPGATREREIAGARPAGRPPGSRSSRVLAGAGLRRAARGSRRPRRRSSACSAAVGLVRAAGGDRRDAGAPIAPRRPAIALVGRAGRRPRGPGGDPGWPRSRASSTARRAYANSVEDLEGARGRGR